MIAAAMLCFFPEGTVIEREDGPDYVARRESPDGRHNRWEALSAAVMEPGYVPELLSDSVMAGKLVKDPWGNTLANVTVVFPRR